jgi:hypothetical protein
LKNDTDQNGICLNRFKTLSKIQPISNRHTLLSQTVKHRLQFV